MSDSKADGDGKAPEAAVRRITYNVEQSVAERREGTVSEISFKLDSGEEVELDEDHAKCLYLISKYARCALTADEEEGWIRQMPLLTLIYEGVTAEVLDFDYAPQSRLVSADGRSQRMWINISQEGKAAVDDLREWLLINGLKLSTEDFQPVTAFQISAKGLKLLKKIPAEWKEDVDAFVYPLNPKRPTARDLMQVTFETASELEARRRASEGGDDDDDDSDDDLPGKFVLVTESGYRNVSLITDAEDVSYVSSPFLPAALRVSDSALTDNARRAHESAMGRTNIRDELSIAVELDTVRALVAEWIPFGANQIVALNERLGAMDRCQGGLFTAMVDSKPNDTQFEVPVGLTQVKILDFDMVRHINFEAEIMYPEEEGIVQVENFGMHLNVDGTILYGIKVEAILDMLAHCTCVDHLSRLLVDVHQDSSQIMNDLLSPYQRSLLDMVFNGDTMARNKFNLILAEGMNPFLDASQYMDRSERENELKQVLGDMHGSYNLGPKDRLILGGEGSLAVGPLASMEEDQLIVYVSLVAKELMIKNFFTRTFILDDELRKVRKLTLTYKADPNRLPLLREKLQLSTRNVILLKEVLDYVREALHETNLPTPKSADVGATMAKVLDLKTMHRDLQLRVKDLGKLMDGANNKVKILQLQVASIDKATLETTVKSIDQNFDSLVAASAAEQRASASIELMNIIFSGSFAFDLIDRMSGDDFLGAVGVDDGRGLSWLNVGIKDALAKWPFFWFFLNMLWLFLVGYALRTLMARLVKAAEGAMSMSKVVQRRIYADKLQEFLSVRSLETQDIVGDFKTNLKKYAWEEEDEAHWKGAPPKITILVETGYNFLLDVVIQWNYNRSEVKEQGQAYALFEKLLEDAGVFDDTEHPVAGEEDEDETV